MLITKHVQQYELLVDHVWRQFVADLLLAGFNSYLSTTLSEIFLWNCYKSTLFIYLISNSVVDLLTLTTKYWCQCV